MSTPAPSPSLIYNWGYTTLMDKHYMCFAVGAAAMYWYAGGIATDPMELVKSYLVGGVAVYGYEMVVAKY